MVLVCLLESILKKVADIAVVQTCLLLLLFHQLDAFFEGGHIDVGPTQVRHLVLDVRKLEQQLQKDHTIQLIALW